MSKQATKWIQDNAVSTAKFRAANDSFIRARNAANTADLNLIKANSSDKAEFGIEPVYSGAPSGATSLVNKQWVEDVLAGVRDPKDAVRVASVANLNLSSMPSAVDGITLTTGDRFLAKNQTTASENGIYVYQGSGNAATRATDFDQTSEVTQGASCDVIEGTVNGVKRFLLTTPDPITVGTTSLTFVQIPTAATQVSFKRNVFVLAGGDITNGYVDLTNVAEHQSVMVWPDGGLLQRITSDFTLTNPSNTRLTFAGDLLDLAAADVLIVNFAHF